MPPKALVLRTAGTNCDRETEFAFQTAGAAADRVHVNRLIAEPQLLDGYQILCLPGGFSYGDDLGAGRVLASQLLVHLRDRLADFIARGNLAIGICNGFQVLVKTGLLPGPVGDDTSPMQQTTTVTYNDSGKFEDRWVHLRVDTDHCVFLEKGEIIYLPIAHGEGKVIPLDKEHRQALERLGRVALRYVGPNGEDDPGYPGNPNGSLGDIAGMTDATGHILGLMPHPERHLTGYQHPQWTRLGAKDEGDGLRLFTRAVKFFA
ncbi:MAG: phosphoribosylformylglycinamidine synthase I [Planctomycetes bacterium]|nr:phosphoribosylformylglycinamidine synthase I [Planctomycetota bacterium]